MVSVRSGSIKHCIARPNVVPIIIVDRDAVDCGENTALPAARGWI
jgi:hypothetical protein